MRGKLLAAVPAAVILAFAAPAAADAAQRYVSPTGSGSTCTAAAPCSLTTGVGSAGTGDEVIVTPGTYSSATTVESFNGVWVHGQAGAPRPNLILSGVGGLSLFGTGSRASDLNINHTGSGSGLAITADGGKAERVQVLSSGLAACQVGYNGVLRDSLCKVTSASGQAYTFNLLGATVSLKLRNVTAIAPGASAYGVAVFAGNNTTINVSLKNVIADGGASDLHAQTGAAPSTVSIIAEYSNYDSATSVGAGATVNAPGSGTNQTAPPLFADTTGYHQAPGSPTIDAGTVDANTGSKDLDGHSRPQGAAMDIGVDELAVPDTSPPETTITKRPKKKTKKRRARFAFISSEAGSTFECKVDKKPFEPCSSPRKLKRLKRGRHRFKVRATDAAGNTDATPAKYRWKVKRRR